MDFNIVVSWTHFTKMASATRKDCFSSTRRSSGIYIYQWYLLWCSLVFFLTQKICQKKLKFCFVHSPLFFRPVPYLQDLITQDLFIKKIWPIYFCKYFRYMLILDVAWFLSKLFFPKAHIVLDRALLEAANKNKKVEVIVIRKQYFLKL